MLSERAVLVSLSIGQPQQKKIDKAQTRAMQERTGAKQGAAGVVKNLIDRDSYEPIRTLINELRAYHYARTAPWIDKGARILSSAGYMDYAKGVQAYRLKIEAARDKMVGEILQVKVDTAVSLGSMYDDAEFPDTDELRSRIYVRSEFLPVPQSGDFRIIGIDDGDKAMMDASLMRLENEAMRGAMADVQQRISTVVKDMASTLAGTSVRFHNTLVTNVTDLCDLLPTLNFADDPTIDTLASEIKAKLTQHDAPSLKNNDTLRQQVAGDASALAKRMDSLWG